MADCLFYLDKEEIFVSRDVTLFEEVFPLAELPSPKSPKDADYEGNELVDYVQFLDDDDGRASETEERVCDLVGVENTESGDGEVVRDAITEPVEHLDEEATEKADEEVINDAQPSFHLRFFTGFGDSHYLFYLDSDFGMF